MNSNDFIPGLDPTGFANITGAQLAELVSTATPSSDRGLTLVTTDAAGVPVLPDTTDFPRVENYLWIRLSPLTSSFIVCAWNPSQIYYMGYSNSSGMSVGTNWNPISSGAIPAGTIVDSMIANGTISADKLAGGITTSQLASGASFLLTSTTPTLGDITNTSSFAGGLIIAPLAVTTGKIANLGVTTPNLAANAVTLVKFDNTGLINQILGNPTAGVPTWITPNAITTGLAAPNAGGANDGQIVAVNSGAAGTFKYINAPQTYTKVVVDNIAIPSSGTFSVSTAHTLAGVPQSVRMVLHCITNDASTAYAAGDEIELSNITNSSNQVSSFSWIVNATNIVLQRYTTGSLSLLKKGVGTSLAVTSEANFVVKFYAILFS